MMMRLFLLIAMLVATASAQAEAPVLRVTVHGGKVLNNRQNQVPDEQAAWTPFTPVKGGANTYVVLKAGDPAKMFSKFAKAVTSTKTNDVSPTWMETLTLGPQDASAFLYYAIYARRGPKDRKHDSADQKKGALADQMLGDGKLNVNEMASVFGSSGAFNVELKGGQTLRLFINWSTPDNCPQYSKTNFQKRLLASVGRNHCVCEHTYSQMSPEGVCTPLRENVRTCNKNMKRNSRISPCPKEEQKCKDLDWTDQDEFHAKCGATEPCDYFKCSGK